MQVASEPCRVCALSWRCLSGRTGRSAADHARLLSRTAAGFVLPFRCSECFCVSETGRGNLPWH
eukprot:524027-Prymnesium_polylepis.2